MVQKHTVSVKPTRSSLQTKLTDFDDDSGELRLPDGSLKARSDAGQIWKSVVGEESECGVCNLDGTVLLVHLTEGKIVTHGFSAVCRWCGDSLEIRGSQIFCTGKCGRYQGEFSSDLTDYLRWEGVKSYTLRREVARIEGLQLEDRDLEPISYAPKWSILDEYDEESTDDQADNHD